MTTGSNVLLMLVAMGLESPAAAIAPTPVIIDFTAPAGCSSLDSFYRGVRSRTDRVRLASPGEPGVQIRVRVLRAGPNISGELRIGDQQEESETRRVDGISCNEVVEALSLTAALALDPSASLLSERNPMPEQSPPPQASTAVPAASASLAPPPPPTIAPSRDVNPSEKSEARRGTEIDLSAHAFGATYVTPDFMFGAQVGLRFDFPIRHWSRLSTGVQVFHLSNDLIGAADASIFRITGVGMSICPAYGALNAWIELGACAIARGAWLRATGLGLTHPQTVVRPWWGLGVESLASVRLHGHWGIELSAGVIAPLVIRKFNSGGGSEARDVGKTPIIGAQMGVGIAYRF